MPGQSNADILREAMARWNDCKAGDLTMWDEYTSEDMCLRSMGEGQHGINFSSARNGREQMHSYLAELTNAFEMEHWTLEETVSEGDRVVGLGTTAWTCKATGKRVETPIVLVCRFRGGRICELHEFYDSASVAASTC
ncbi:nuclear transport factor 2 family protein [Leisingera daeponensis]|uniref:Nuclear transport factor 2 family protein n=1 Tax=Leisingera daeponensis TaxID=405746 RepID=A0ABS7NGE1_9RHOB|nr:nuclear transport factor 2 family protein [Leisingera daeponensis]MBY6140283.1 nuclear transport factor 2 family protein [Leisingera daeponensis]